MARSGSIAIDSRRCLFGHSGSTRSRAALRPIRGSRPASWRLRRPPAIAWTAYARPSASRLRPNKPSPRPGEPVGLEASHDRVQSLALEVRIEPAQQEPRAFQLGHPAGTIGLRPDAREPLRAESLVRRPAAFQAGLDESPIQKGLIATDRHGFAPPMVRSQASLRTDRYAPNRGPAGCARSKPSLAAAAPRRHRPTMRAWRGSGPRG